MTEPRAFLGVESSALGRRWVGPDVARDRQAEAIWQATSLPPAVCAVLARADVAPETAQDYLTPSLRALLPDPRGLKDMECAATRILSAVTRRERIAIFADYDVDGACSAALLLDWLADLGSEATLYVPDRLTEGYGPNAPAMAQLADDHDLIICVDCGTMAHEALAAATDADVVVLDHHLGGETLPPALAIVNPNRQDEDSGLGHLCAAGVVFLLLVEANRQGRAQGIQGPDLMTLLDLVALATVADVAPLLGVNRAFVRQGLKIMAGRTRPGLRTLSDIARLDSAPRAYHLGYVIGPRINAGGRIGTADMGARLLATRDEAEAEAFATRLDLLNTERREIEAAVRASALAQAETRGTDSPLAWAAGDGWHPGVIGIAAARLKEATNRPAIVIALEGEIGKGSGRSVPGVDLGAAIHRLVREGLLLAGGGHKMAAGLTVAQDRLEAAMDRLAEILGQQGAGNEGPRSLRLDGALMPGAVTPELVAQLEAAGPFGASAPAPRFALADMRVENPRRMGDTHLRFRCSGGDGTRLDVICFGAFDSPLGPLIAAHQGRNLHLAGQVEINFWGGRQTPQLRLEDAAIPRDAG